MKVKKILVSQPEPSSEKLTSAKRLAERSSAELSVKTESESVPE